MIKILLVEDNINLRMMMHDALEQESYKVFVANDGKEALQIMDKQHVDLMITDVMMPTVDGFELTKCLRDANYDLPVLMITAKGTYADKENGFTIGVDDYMVKPVDLKEMHLRVKALLRRSKIYHDHMLQVGRVILNQEAYTVMEDGHEQTLPVKEFQLLFQLLSNPNTIYTRLQLMDMIWGLDSDTDERTVDVHVQRIRKKFDHIKSFEIITVRGLGYKGVIEDV